MPQIMLAIIEQKPHLPLVSKNTIQTNEIFVPKIIFVFILYCKHIICLITHFNSRNNAISRHALVLNPCPSMSFKAYSFLGNNLFLVLGNALNTCLKQFTLSSKTILKGKKQTHKFHVQFYILQNQKVLQLFRAFALTPQQIHGQSFYLISFQCFEEYPITERSL